MDLEQVKEWRSIQKKEAFYYTESLPALQVLVRFSSKG